MFVLRRITSESLHIHTAVGKKYSHVDKVRNPVEFKNALKALKWEDTGDVHGFIVYDQGASVEPLYSSSTYFMMTEEGKTFDNLTLKTVGA